MSKVKRKNEEKILTEKVIETEEKETEKIVDNEVIEQRDEIKENDETIEEEKENDAEVGNSDKKAEQEKNETDPKENVNSTIEKEEALKDEKENNENNKIDFLQKYTWIIGIVAIVLLIVAIIFSTIFGITNKNSTKIVKGISIANIDVSDLTREEAMNKLNTIANEKLEQSISLGSKEYNEQITPTEIDANINLEEAVNLAYSVGRNGKILKDNFQIINTYLSKINIKPAFSYNEEKLNEAISNLSDNLPDKLQESGYYVENNSLIITKGKSGFVIKQEELKDQIVRNISTISDVAQIEIPVEIKEPENIDIQKIYKEVYKEPKNAYYTKEPFVVYPHVDGVDFEITLEEAKNLIKGEENQITIPLKITSPEITTNQIGTEAFPDLLSTYSTTFSTKNTNRTTNIKLAANKVNGVVLMPDEEFSYNAVVGKRTAAAGYKSAAVYVAGKVVDGIGGGICQVSSTLYNATLRANLQTIKRSNHRFATGYVPLSTDATVSWGGPEFIFKNSRKYPIKIVCEVIGGKIRVDIYGCKEEVEYDVQIKSETLQTIPSKVTYRINTQLPKGTSKTVQKGHAGYKSRAYRILKLNGEIVSQELLSNDNYAQLETIIEHNP